MPAASSVRVPSYRHHKPTDQAVVTLNGQDFYLGKWNTKASRAEYERLIGEWLTSGRCLPKTGTDLTIVELVFRYWKFCRSLSITPYVLVVKELGDLRARKPGRPPIQRELRDLIRRMSREDPLWGAPRILSELLLLGYHAAERTVANYMARTRKPPSQKWRTFLANHVPDIAACDFFIVPTVTFRVLYVFIVLRHDRRRVVHFNVTDHPYAE